MSVNIEAMSVEKTSVRRKSKLVLGLRTAVLGKSGNVFRITGSLLGKGVAVLWIGEAVLGDPEVTGRNIGSVSVIVHLDLA
jgi:hypothetical protein